MTEIVAFDTSGTPHRRSVTESMANRFGMEANTFMATLDSTVFPRNMSREEKAAFLLVAQEYRLNPITREIYAMPKKGGGLIPVVSIDGWVRLANEHPQFDGMEFEDCHSETGELVSTTCRIFRKDRRHPICVTEYYDECKRETEPWKMKHRMLRHKAMIQCSRYAFGFAGIYDQDEAERFAEAGPVHQARRAPAPTAQLIEQRAEPVETHVPRRAPPPEIEPTAPAVSPLNAFRARAAEAQDTEQLGEAWNEIVEPLYDRMLPHEQDEYLAIIRTRTAELASDDDGGEAREP